MAKKLSESLEFFKYDRPDAWTMEEFIQQSKELEKPHPAIQAVYDDEKLQCFHISAFDDRPGCDEQDLRLFACLKAIKKAVDGE